MKALITMTFLRRVAVLIFAVSIVLVARPSAVHADGQKGSTSHAVTTRSSRASAADVSSSGYWLAGTQGGIGAYGGTTFYGSMSSTRLNAPVVAMAATPDEKGYWLAASDGGVFTFGDASFKGSVPGALPPGTRLAQPVVGMAATPDGRGYWLVAADGGVFTFGDATFYGSVPGVLSPGTRLAQPVVGMAATPDGRGYWLVAADGGVFTFGDAPFRGSGSGYIPIGEWVTAVADAPGSAGGSDSGDFTNPVPQQVAGQPYDHGATGFDISWPQCGGAYPPPASVAVVGVNGGSAFTGNPCFGSEASWGGANLTIYLNLNSPQGSDSTQWGQGPAGNCALGDLNCESYNYGFNTAAESVTDAFFSGHGARTFWLDIETGNYWTSDSAANDLVIAGAIDAIHGSGFNAAIYSTNYQWGQIAGSYVPSVPVWYPTGIATSSPNHWCSATSFAGGPVYLVQDAAGSYDGDYSC
jgi:hypothetical protein